LAYSVFSSYSESSEADKADYLYSYIGIQSDKQEEALYSMFDLIHNLPESPQAFEVAKQAILNKIESERITKRNVLENYLVAEKKGINFDIREQIYNEVKTMKIEDLSAFHKNHIKDKPHNILLIGNRNNINFDNLKQYGKVQELSLETLFGY
jgi:zinc protease